jgi:4a-hydroxytetrahydrobiopterin dehydratase
MSRQASALAGSERETALSKLIASGWSVVPNRDAIQKKYEFKDFVDAWGFMSR